MTATLTIKTTITVISRQSRIYCTAKVDLPEYGIQAGQKFLLLRKSGTTYVIQKIEVLSCHVFDNGSAQCQVRNAAGKVYTTTLHHDTPHTCTCADTTGHCYHIQLLKHEVNTHIRAQKAVRKQQQPVIAAPVLSNAERGTLNGNRPFSLLKAA